MCFHINIKTSISQLEKKLKASYLSSESYQLKGEVSAFTYPKLPILLANEQIKLGSWGLIPSWADDSFNKNYTLNARIETITEKKSFKNVVQNRCIIPVNGFYEWQHNGKVKTKYFIHFKEEIFGLAGLYSLQNEKITFTILTTEALGVMREIHNSKLRMPVAFKNLSSMDDWIKNGENTPNYDFETQALEPKQGTLF